MAAVAVSLPQVTRRAFRFSFPWAAVSAAETPLRSASLRTPTFGPSATGVKLVPRCIVRAVVGALSQRCFNALAAAGWRCRIGVGPVFGIGGAFAFVVESCSLSYRVRMSTHLGPNPAVNTDAPVRAFVLGQRRRGAPVT